VGTEWENNLKVIYRVLFKLWNFVGSIRTSVVPARRVGVYLIFVASQDRVSSSEPKGNNKSGILNIDLNFEFKCLRCRCVFIRGFILFGCGGSCR